MTWHTAWDAYDVPRLWDAVRQEDAPLGWEQVCGLRRRADLLAAHVDDLRARRDRLADAWHGPAAAALLGRWDALITTAAEESSHLTVAARGLHGVMTALSTAKQRIEPLTRQWDSITSDWIPDFWDEVAAELNEEARTAMLVAAAEIRDHRSRWPAGSPAADATPPPALPGYPPTTGTDTQVTGMPAAVPAVPGQPMSMLPIPPGNPYAPHGGAYLLPGPGVGRHGRVVHMDEGSVFARWFERAATPWRVAA